MAASTDFAVLVNNMQNILPDLPIVKKNNWRERISHKIYKKTEKPKHPGFTVSKIVQVGDKYFRVRCFFNEVLIKAMSKHVVDDDYGLSNLFKSESDIFAKKSIEQLMDSNLPDYNWATFEMATDDTRIWVVEGKPNPTSDGESYKFKIKTVQAYAYDNTLYYYVAKGSLPNVDEDIWLVFNTIEKSDFLIKFDI